jgi:hypothetical protein
VAGPGNSRANGRAMKAIEKTNVAKKIVTSVARYNPLFSNPLEATTSATTPRAVSVISAKIAGVCLCRMITNAPRTLPDL